MRNQRRSNFPLFLLLFHLLSLNFWRPLWQPETEFEAEGGGGGPGGGGDGWGRGGGAFLEMAGRKEKEEEERISFFRLPFLVSLACMKAHADIEKLERTYLQFAKNSLFENQFVITGTVFHGLPFFGFLCNVYGKY